MKQNDGRTFPHLTEMLSSDPILVASHPRSGTHLVIDLLRRQFPETRVEKELFKPLDSLYLNIERTVSQTRRLSKKDCGIILKAAKNPILKTHFRSDFTESWIKDESYRISSDVRSLISSALIIYVHRHPFDVMESYRSLLASSSREVAALDVIEFALSPHWNGNQDRIGWWAQHVQGWAARDDALVIRYMDLLRSPDLCLDQIEKKLGLKAIRIEPLLPKNERSIWRGRLSRLMAVDPSSTAILSRVKSLDRFSS